MPLLNTFLFFLCISGLIYWFVIAHGRRVRWSEMMFYIGVNLGILVAILINGSIMFGAESAPTSWSMLLAILMVLSIGFMLIASAIRYAEDHELNASDQRRQKQEERMQH